MYFRHFQLETYSATYTDADSNWQWLYQNVERTCNAR